MFLFNILVGNAREPDTPKLYQILLCDFISKSGTTIESHRLYKANELKTKLGEFCYSVAENTVISSSSRGGDELSSKKHSTKFIENPFVQVFLVQSYFFLFVAGCVCMLVSVLYVSQSVCECVIFSSLFFVGQGGSAFYWCYCCCMRMCLFRHSNLCTEYSSSAKQQQITRISHQFHEISTAFYFSFGFISE